MYFAFNFWFSLVYTEGAKKMYTHFKKGKNCIKIVILNLYRWLSCLLNGAASIHLINTIFWVNVLLHIVIVIQFNFEK